jgi:hypothetical protein
MRQGWGISSVVGGEFVPNVVVLVCRSFWIQSRVVGGLLAAESRTVDGSLSCLEEYAAILHLFRGG